MSRFQPAQPTGFSHRASFALVAILFFLSGAAGLIYQTVWVRLLELYFGVTLTAITLIVSAYMAGLGLGSLLGGRIAGKSKNTILLYGIIEVGIGAFGIYSPTLINWVGQNTAGSPYTLVFLFSFALLLVPTLLMGMTLPLLTQAFVTRVESSGRVIGLLYGINTLGAAIGALVSGYILIGWFGFSGALLTAALLNFLVGVGALPLKPGTNTPTLQPTDQPAPSPEPTRPLWNFHAIAGSAFLVGFIGMGFEMVWFRMLGIFTKHTAYSFPSILFTFLVALALGGWYWGNKADQSKDPVRLFWKLQIGVGLTAVASFLLIWMLINLPGVQPWLRENFPVVQRPVPPFVHIQGELVLMRRTLLFGLLEYFLPILILILPTGFLMGGGLPILDRIAIDQVALSGRRVGDIHLANIAGSVSGTLVTSFILLPVLGSEITFKVLSALTFTFLAFALLTRRGTPDRRLLIPALGLLAAMLFLPGKGAFYTRLYQNATERPSVAIHEGNDSVLAITFREDGRNPTGLWIGGIQNSFFPSSGGYERSAMTCAAAVQPRRALIIGVGGGNTAMFLASLPELEELVIVELLEPLGGFLEEHVPVARAVFAQPHVRYIVDDGRRYLYANPDEKFDLIFIDPLWSFTAGHNNLYSREAMQLYKSHLTPGGVFCAWINEPHLIPRTAASVFAHSDHFSGYLVNSDQPLAYDIEYMSAMYEHYLDIASQHLTPSAAERLSPTNILESRQGNRAQAHTHNHQPLLTDLTPWLEYYFLCPPRFARQLDLNHLQYCHLKR